MAKRLATILRLPTASEQECSGEESTDPVHVLRTVVRNACRRELKRIVMDPTNKARVHGAMQRAARPATRNAELRRYCNEVDDVARLMASDLSELCELAQTSGYPAANIWLTFPDTNCLESIASSCRKPHSFYGLRRPIPKDSSLRDMIVDVKERGVGERILDGRFDPRYDRRQWEAGEHQLRDRLFIPLIVVRKKEGMVCQALCRWLKKPVNATTQNWVPVCRDPSVTIEVIGTLELGSDERVDEAVVEKALRLSLKIAASAFSATLPGVIERLLDVVRSASQAPSTTIHFVPDGDARTYFRLELDERGDTPHLCYVGKYNRQAREEGYRPPGVVGGPPRSTGVGVEVLNDGVPRHLRGRELEERNRGLWTDGVRGLSVYPLCSGDSEPLGLLYLHQFDLEKDLLTDFAFDVLIDRVGQALSQAALGLRQRRRAQDRLAVDQLIHEFVGLERFMPGATQPHAVGDSEDLSRDLADALVTLLGADLVEVRVAGGSRGTAGRYRGTPDELPRGVTVPLIANGDALGSVFVGYADGNTFLDRNLIQKLVGIGAHAINLSQVHGPNEYRRARNRVMAELCQNRSRITVGVFS